MTPEQIEWLEGLEDHLDIDGQDQWRDALRALLAEWEERGRALDRAAIARGEAESLIEERGREIERLRDIALELRRDPAHAECTAEIERLKAERDEARATKDMHKERTEQAEARLAEQKLLTASYATDLCAMDREIERLKAEVIGTTDALDKAWEARGKAEAQLAAWKRAIYETAEVWGPGSSKVVADWIAEVERRAVLAAAEEA